jgi:hypothetical protein
MRRPRKARRFVKTKSASGHDPFGDPEPKIIQWLRIIRDRDRVPADHELVDQVYRQLETILQHWERDEAMGKLRAELGVGSKKKRRSSKSAQRYLTYANAVVSAALMGKKNPMDAAAVELHVDLRTVQRAWKEWRKPKLEGLLLTAQPGDEKMRAAIDRLKGRDTK